MVIGAKYFSMALLKLKEKKEIRREIARIVKIIDKPKLKHLFPFVHWTTILMASKP